MYTKTQVFGMPTIADTLDRLDKLISQGTTAVDSRVTPSNPPLYSARSNTVVIPGQPYIDSGLVKQFKAASLSFLKSVFGEQHPYYVEFAGTCRNQAVEETKNGVHVLKAARQEIKDGYLGTVQQLLRAEVFADFLEMAEHLLEQGYKDPAAVMTGSVLEDHIRHLATKHGIPVTIEKDGKQVPKKADGLNSELKKAEVYGQLDQKAVTTWLDLRNNAAHGKYDQYTKEQVQIMLSGVLDFVRRVTLK